MLCSLSSLFTHSWVSRHLACLHVLTVVNSAAVSVGVHVIFLNYVCLVAQSCPTLCDPRDCSPPGPSVHVDSPPGKNSGVGCQAILQEIFPTQGSNSDLQHCRQILYRLLNVVLYRYMPRSGIARSHGSSTFSLFSFLS